ncbi:DUF1761 domain-containing protein [Gordonia soli]|uniref:DUF1761 domain-containing protein n=1 Tax=Gordonia soli NBRC 108243 TaxID=1223545 RepID=M0QLF6_9ACTN|nr:DUF1761 domain-containing protein [Gordonia soli]GAC69373.1 hypothetical protein GS4_24_00190 [Gordonia soli NBRC 108243]
MELNIDWLAVVIAIVVGMAVAWVWYSDWGLVGSTWRRLTGVTADDSARGGKAPFVILVASIVVTAIALAAASSVAEGFFETDSLWLAVGVGAAAWLGFSLTTLAQHNGFELKPAALTAINSAYQLVLFVGMTVPIGLLQ